MEDGVDTYVSLIGPVDAERGLIYSTKIGDSWIRISAAWI